MVYSGEYEKTAKVKEAYEQIAVSYDRVRAKPWKECVKFIQSFNAGSLVLDLGCGNGRHTLASVMKGHETIGVDFSKNMLMVAKEKFKTIQAPSGTFHLVMADVTHLPFRDNSFEYVLYIATLHNIPTRSLRLKSLCEVKRVLKPGGKCLISVWKRLQFRFLFLIIKTYLKRIIGMKGNFEAFLPWKVNDSIVYRYYYLYSAKQLKKDIKDSGMKILNFSKIKISTLMISDNYFVTVTKTK